MNKAGLKFENRFLEALEECKEYIHSSNNDDKCKGVDFYWFGLPIDITLQPLRKKTCCYHLTECVTPYGTVDIGIRIGNIHEEGGVYKEFYYDDNVLVLSFNRFTSMSWANTHSLVRDIIYATNSDDVIDEFWELSDKLDSIVKRR